MRAIGGLYESSTTKDHLFTYELNLLTPQVIEIPAFSGPNVVVNSYFESDDDYAFFWLTDESLDVPVPADISEGNISLAGEKRSFGEIFNEPYQNGANVTVSVPAGQSKYTTYIGIRIQPVLLGAV